MGTTDIDRRIDILEGRTLHSTTGTLDIYVSGVSGDDSAAGTESAPIATIAEAYRRTPDIVRDPVRIHLGPHAGAGYEIPTFQNKKLYNNVYVFSDETTTLSTGIADAGGSVNALVDTVGGFTVDEHLGVSIEILTGDAAGDRRMVTANTADTFTPSAPFSAAISAGDTYRLFEPSVVVFCEEGLPATPGSGLVAKNAGNFGRLGDSLSPFGIDDGRGMLVFANLIWDTTSVEGGLASSTIAFWGIKITGDDWQPISQGDSLVLMGMDVSQPSAFAPMYDLGAKSSTSWKGWGVSQTNAPGGMSFFTKASGYIISGPAGTLGIQQSAQVVLYGGRILAGLISFSPGQLPNPHSMLIKGASASLPFIIDGKVTLQGLNVKAQFLWCTIDSAEDGVAVLDGAECRLGSTTITVTGTNDGIVASTQGKVTFSNVTVNVATGVETRVTDAEGVDVTRTIAAYDAKGKYIAVSDGTVIQRVI